MHSSVAKLLKPNPAKFYSFWDTDPDVFLFPRDDGCNFFLWLEEEYREGASTAASLDHHLTEIFET